MTEWLFALQNDFETQCPMVQKKIYQSFYQHVYQDLQYILKDHALTEDIIQDAFIKIIKIISLNEINHISPWIKRVTRNLALDQLKKVKKEQLYTDSSYIDILQGYIDSEYRQISTAREIEDKQRNKVLYETIYELQSEYRDLILLFYFNNKSYKEIAAAIDLTDQAVSQKLYRARKKLHQRLQLKGIDLDV